MNRRDFDTHSVWGILEETQNLLVEIDKQAGETGSQDSLDDSQSLNELRLVLADSDALKTSDRLHLIGGSMLDALGGGWQAVNDSLRRYLQGSSNSAQYLDAARSRNLDEARAALVAFPEPDESSAKKAARTRAVSALVSEADAARQALVQQVISIRAAHESFVESQNNDQQALADEIGSLSKRAEALQTQIRDDEDRLSAALTANNDSFLTAQTERQERFSRWLDQQEDSFTDLAAPHIEELERLVAHGKKVRAEIDQLRDDIVELSNLTTGDILAGEYRVSARNDRRAGYIGYAVGMATGLLGICIILFAFGDLRDALSWSEVAIKLGLTTAVGGVAAVAFRFGGQSFARATSFKRQELELRAMAPFLQGVQGADEAKILFARQAFGRAWEQSNGNGEELQDPSTSSEALRIAQSAVEALSKVNRA